MLSNKLKKILFLSVSALIILLSGLFAFFKQYDNVSNKIAQTYQNDNYVLGVYQEKIAVFTQGDSVPIEIFDVYVSTLPKADQKTLRKGIAVKGKSELKRIVEDYTS